MPENTGHVEPKVAIGIKKTQVTDLAEKPQAWKRIYLPRVQPQEVVHPKKTHPWEVIQPPKAQPRHKLQSK